MKLYTSMGPNPKVVRMFLAEKGVAVETVEVDMAGGENRRQPYLELNPMGQIPVLDTGKDGRISEITAICEYIEEIHPQPALIGTTAAERAETRMWVRRLDLSILEPMGSGFRYGEGLKFFQDRVPCLPEASDGLKAIARHYLAWLDERMDARTFICGERFTLADIMLHAWLRFFGRQGQPLDPTLARLAAWNERIAARPSAKA